MIQIYCLIIKYHTENRNANVLGISNNRTSLSICEGAEKTFIKEKEAKWKIIESQFNKFEKKNDSTTKALLMKTKRNVKKE